MSCYFCENDRADFDVNGLKFCDEKCAIKHAYSELEEVCNIVDIEMVKTRSNEIPTGTRGFVVNPADGLNRVKFENDTTAFCCMNELKIITRKSIAIKESYHVE